VDVAKYRTLFLEEATEHLAEIGQALLVLEKDLRAGDSLDTVFRLMHSMKGMGASLGYDAVSTLAHRLEDRLGEWKKRGGIDGPDGVALLFRGLDSLDRMVAAVRETGEAPPADAVLMAELGEPEPAKKALRLP
jgi:two-component system chemotaxis sensor kinase CheA